MAGNTYLRLLNGTATELAASQSSSGGSDANKIIALDTTGRLDPSLLSTTKPYNIQVVGGSETAYYPINKPMHLDLALTDANLKGFYGGFTDGKYGYFVPYNNGAGYDGYVARVDLSDFSTVTFLDLSATNANLKGFIGGFTDGKYGYFVPHYNGVNHGYVARVDLSDFSTVTFLDLSATNANLKGFYGGFTDGKYGYFVPSNNGVYHGYVARVDLSDFSTVTFLDLSATNANLKGFYGGFTDGKYGYFVPYNNGAGYNGYVARVDLSDFSTVTFLDLSATNANLKGFVGGFTDGKYGYFVPHYNGVYHGYVARVDLSDFSTVTFLDLSATNANLKGFYGGFTDGKYGYFVPHHNGAGYDGYVARVDLSDFSTVTFLDLSATNANLKGFVGGFTDGKYGYFVPYNNGVSHGYVVKVLLLSANTRGI